MAGAARRRRSAIVRVRREPSSREKDKREDKRAKENTRGHAAQSTGHRVRVEQDV